MARQKLRIDAGQIRNGDWLEGSVPTNRVQVHTVRSPDGYKRQVYLVDGTMRLFAFDKPVTVYRDT